MRARLVRVLRTSAFLQLGGGPYYDISVAPIFYASADLGYQIKVALEDPSSWDRRSGVSAEVLADTS